MAKQSFYGHDKDSRSTAFVTAQKVLMAVTKLLHPFMPFITEEIWQRFPLTDGSIMISSFPESSSYPKDDTALQDMQLLMNVISAIRNIRGEMNVPPAKRIHVMIDLVKKEDVESIVRHQEYIRTLATVDEITIGTGLQKPGGSATSVFGKNQVHVLLKGLLNIQEERKRLLKDIEKIEKDLEVCNRKLGNEGFLKKAPSNIIEEVRQKAEVMSQKREKLGSNLALLDEIRD
jgi:valyl-tRNA synthetase